MHELSEKLKKDLNNAILNHGKQEHTMCLVFIINNF